ncbi:MAG: hypothetical protein WAW96_12795, partial [Alphaproteobacteria bacterium]
RPVSRTFVVERQQLRRPTAWLALFAVLIQAFAVQTHIHFDADWNASASLVHAINLAPNLFDSSALSTESDADHCLICHEQMSGGRALAIDAAHLLPPNAAIFVALYAEALSAAYGIISHSWQGRGPPRV